MNHSEFRAAWPLRQVGRLAIAFAAVGSSASLAATASVPPAMAQQPVHPAALESVFEFHGAMPTGVTVSPGGRIFVNFPQWGDHPDCAVAELRDGQLHAYPDAASNRVDPADPASHFISVQSVVADLRGSLWVLDTAAPRFSAPLLGGAKLVQIELASNTIKHTYLLPASVLLPRTYLNDVRFDFRHGQAGFAYITDSSGPGGLIVLDLASGDAWRALDGAPSVRADPGFQAGIDGQRLLTGAAGAMPTPLAAGSDGIAISADGAQLYYSPLTSLHLYRIATKLLRDPNLPAAEVAAGVRDLGLKGASDGLEMDARGRLYAGDYEHHAIVRREVDGTWTVLAQSPQIQWPDTLSLHNGWLYFNANQLNDQPNFHAGVDRRRQPYHLYRMRIAD